MLTGNELIQWLVWGWRIGYGWESSIPHPTALPLGHLSVFLAHSWLSLDWVIPGRRQGEGHQAFYHLITYCHLYNFLLIHWVQPTLRGWGIKCYFLKGEGPQETRVSGRQKDAETFNNNEPTESLWQRKSNLGNTEARCTESEPSAPPARGNKASSAGSRRRAARFAMLLAGGREPWLPMCLSVALKRHLHWKVHHSTEECLTWTRRAGKEIAPTTEKKSASLKHLSTPPWPHLSSPHGEVITLLALK